jgi:hypothetical protein
MFIKLNNLIILIKLIMKKIILIACFLCFTLTILGQEKNNHNTTRSNQSSGIISKGNGEKPQSISNEQRKDWVNIPRKNNDSVDEDCDGILNYDNFTRLSTNKLKSKSWEDATAQAVKENSKAPKKSASNSRVFMSQNVAYSFKGDVNQLNKCINKKAKTNTCTNVPKDCICIKGVLICKSK